VPSAKQRLGDYQSSDLWIQTPLREFCLKARLIQADTAPVSCAPMYKYLTDTVIIMK
jgi:tryptophan 2,3-dioxygenase